MAHPRKQLRAAIVARLKTNTALIALVSTRVYPNRIRSLFQSKLPSILVYTLKEPAEISTESPREYLRNLQVIIEVAANADDALDDTLDDLCEAIEAAIFSEETFGGLCSDTLLTDTEISVLSEGEKLIGSAQITLTLPYYTQLPGDLTGALDAAERFHTDIDLAPGDGENESEDNLDLPQ